MYFLHLHAVNESCTSTSNSSSGGPFPPMNEALALRLLRQIMEWTRKPLHGRPVA
jgi:hypothetical protein